MSQHGELGTLEEETAPEAPPALSGRPLLVTILIVGWILLSFSGAVRGAVAMVTQRAQESTPHGEMMAEILTANPHLLEGDPEWAEQRTTQQQETVILAGRLAPFLLAAAALALVGSVMLIKQNPWCRAVLAVAGLVAVDVSIRHAIGALRITTAHAVDIPEAQGAIETIETVATVNLALMSIPLVLLVGLLFHPVVGQFLRQPPKELDPLGE